MAESFDVKSVMVPVLGTPGADVGYPLIHFPAAGGAVTILEAFISCATAKTHGSLNLFYGTQSASEGSLLRAATIGTAVGTVGAISMAALTLSSPAVVPANNWLGIVAQTGWGLVDNQSSVYIVYVNGR
jgi:hypothetical protein